MISSGLSISQLWVSLCQFHFPAGFLLVVVPGNPRLTSSQFRNLLPNISSRILRSEVYWLAQPGSWAITPYPYQNYNLDQGNEGSLTDQIWDVAQEGKFTFTPTTWRDGHFSRCYRFLILFPLVLSHFSECWLNFQLLTSASLYLKPFSDHQRPLAHIQDRPESQGINIS